MSEVVIAAAVLVQLVNAVLALRLIRATGGVVAWVLISAAIGLMALRRGWSLYLAAAPDPHGELGLSFEVVGLVTSVLMLAGIVLIAPLFRTIRKAEEAQRKLVGELNAALDRVKQLSGLLPICAWCKKVRDDTGYWNTIEAYVRDHSEAEFSHGICPDCAERVYPGLLSEPPVPR